ncbi:hypothetical protein [Paenibacillus sp. Soil522]|uniref:hypothetical protein n=1 Tax=Paenibacillus sp. Soil522 TaxID=1736388 RepID=UPI0006F2CD3D|nr:hypothetical protein [Paenibacillus sp. Soil522]KRE54216.1 hypothetical protein ASG81_00430 [Paenibacillus sp. Soil522]
MEQQQIGKRSIALPITLVILVFSLIGNVFLYSQLLQHKQEQKFVKGQGIYEAAAESRQFLDAMIPQLDSLLQSKSMEERLVLKFDAGKLAADGRALAELTAEAAGISAEPETLDSHLPLTYLSDVENGLQTIGRYEGPLSEAERAYILALKSSFEAMSGIMKGFNTNIGDNRSAIIRLSSGLDWTQLVAKLQKMMLEQPAKLAA